MPSINQIAQRYTFNALQVNTAAAVPTLYFPINGKRWAILMTRTEGQKFGYAFTEGQEKTIQGSLEFDDYILYKFADIGPLVQQAIVITGNGQPNAGWVFEIVDNDA